VVTKQLFGKLDDGSNVDLYILENKNGVQIGVITYGAIVTFIRTPDAKGNINDIALGFDNLEQYVTSNPYFGAIVGRYGNRIAKGKFSLNGMDYTLAVNNGENHLHGGKKGFDKVLWNLKDIKTDEHSTSVELTYFSKDGEEGYPGDLTVNVIYSLSNNNEWKAQYTATTTKETVVNLTNHTYWNLAGQGSGDILQHQIQIEADKFVAINTGLIPTGELKDVKGTPMDFTKPIAIGDRIDEKYEQLELAKGYDHTWVLRKQGFPPSLVATVTEPNSGRILEIFSSEPGVQFYTGNFLDGTKKGKENRIYQKRFGFCLETQHFPDSPNKPQFPSVVLRPGDTYNTTTIYKFTTKK